MIRFAMGQGSLVKIIEKPIDQLLIILKTQGIRLKISGKITKNTITPDIKHINREILALIITKIGM